jgi:putative transcriptional regulator
MNRIKEILKLQGRSQAWLAERIGKSYVVTKNYCNNKTQPKISVLRKIADVLDVDIRELLKESIGPELLTLLTKKLSSHRRNLRSGSKLKRLSKARLGRKWSQSIRHQSIAYILRINSLNHWKSVASGRFSCF